MVDKVYVGKRYMLHGRPVRITSERLVGCNPSIKSGFWADNGQAVFANELSEIEYETPVSKVD